MMQLECHIVNFGQAAGWVRRPRGAASTPPGWVPETADP